LVDIVALVDLVDFPAFDLYRTYTRSLRIFGFAGRPDFTTAHARASPDSVQGA
jgi:hypothetical protein